MKLTLLTFFILLHALVFAATWNVGPTRTYTKPSLIAPLVNHGDTIYIDAATYAADVCAWTKNNLVIIGINGRPHLPANGAYVMGKGIWVFAGNNITVKNVEFSGARVPDQNGAGIRLDGVGVTVENCYFHDNENGILTANNGGKIAVRNSEFGYNGDGRGQAHNIYIGRVDTALIEYNYFHHASVGHEFKSRARVNYLLYNRFSDETTGTASRNIDLPDGGLSYIIGNIIQQGANSPNNNMVGYGLESLTNAAPHALYVINNTFVNNRSGCLFLSAAGSTATLKVYNNIFAGAGTLINFGGVLDSSNNLVQPTIGLMGFTDPSNFDYQLTNSSPAINAGTDPGPGLNNFSLLPTFQYKHPAQSSLRQNSTPITIGAYEPASAPLAVNYGTIVAQVTNNILNVNWTTTQELNNKHFEIEVSWDSHHFTVIGTVNTKAISGQSHTNLTYSFSTPVQSISFSLLAGLLIITSTLGSRRNRGNTLIILLILPGFWACKKEQKSELGSSEKLFVRIAQTDINSIKMHSKIIKADITE